MAQMATTNIAATRRQGRRASRPIEQSWVQFATEHAFLVTGVLTVVYLASLGALVWVFSASMQDTIVGRAVMVLFGALVLLVLAIAVFCMWPEGNAVSTSKPQAAARA